MCRMRIFGGAKISNTFLGCLIFPIFFILFFFGGGWLTVDAGPMALYEEK